MEEFIHRVFSCLPGDRYCSRFRSPLLCPSLRMWGHSSAIPSVVLLIQFDQCRLTTCILSVSAGILSAPTTLPPWLSTIHRIGSIRIYLFQSKLADKSFCQLAGQPINSSVSRSLSQSLRVVSKHLVSYPAPLISATMSAIMAAMKIERRRTYSAGIAIPPRA